MSNGNHFFNFITLDVNNPPVKTIPPHSRIDLSLITALPVPISIWQKIDDNYYLIYINKSAKKIFEPALTWGMRLDKAFPVEYQNILTSNPSEDSFYQRLDNDLLMLCHYLNDQSNYKQTSAKNGRLEQEALQKIIEPSPVSIIITDINGNIEYVNPKFVEVSGYSSNEIIGKKPSILKSGDKSSEDYKTMWETILSGKVWRGEFINKKKNGEIYYEYAVISPLKDNQGKIKNFIAFKEDITKLKTTENELSQSEKFASLGKMAAFVSHQIKTPLSSIKLSVDLLEQDPSICGDAHKSISIIQKEVKRLTELLKEVLQFSNQSKLYFSEINLSKKFENIHTFLKPLLKARGIKLNNKTSGNLIYGDPQQLRSLFLHLLENAIESIDKEGEIEISSRMEQNECHILIKDNGCGITNGKEIFEPFFTTKSSGAGFGLPIAKNIVEKHNGQLKLLSSKPGETIFEIILPMGNKGGKTSDY
ncbi:MAG TPA: PAS domain S-box protein [Ignavibacteriaceae bacterium]|nr:PAS domain S-box protein [Ignavibacteriaceae bacterium]